MVSESCQTQVLKRGLPSMLFSMEDDESMEAEEESSLYSAPVSYTLRLVQEAADSVSSVLAEVAEQEDLVCAAQALGYTVRLRDCVGGGQGAACLRNLRHSFLILSPSQASAGSNCSRDLSPQAEEVIIDPTFKDQFIIAHPSPRYTAVLDALPPVFIGTASKVQPLVELLCSEMALAFQAAGIVLPPWRSLRSMMSKWHPRRSLDVPLPPAASTAAAAGAVAVPATTAAIAPAPVSAASGGVLKQFGQCSNKIQPVVAGAAAATAAMAWADHTANSHAATCDRLLHRAGGVPEVASSTGPSSRTTAGHSTDSSSTDSSIGCGMGAAASADASQCSSGAAAAAAGLSRFRNCNDQADTHMTGAVPCLAAARRGGQCVEPLQRFVGGFSVVGTSHY